MSKTRDHDRHRHRHRNNPFETDERRSSDDRYHRHKYRERSRERDNERRNHQSYRDRRRHNRDSVEDRKFNINDHEERGSHNWGKPREKKEDEVPIEKEKPNFAVSGKLTEDKNKLNGVVVKYSEPDEARKPKRRWRLYPFKGETALPTLYIHRQSCYLIGRDRKVCDLPVDHPSCSKQHAAIQYRMVPFQRPDGTTGKRVRPYIIDLESANGTFVNNKQIDPRKYIELLERDVIKFGFSSREYVLLHENSQDESDDDIKNEG